MGWDIGERHDMRDVVCCGVTSPNHPRAGQKWRGWMSEAHDNILDFSKYTCEIGIGIRHAG